MVECTALNSISFIVPTFRQDRPLKRCLDSIAWQLGDSDQVIVVGDTIDGDLPLVEQLVSTYGDKFMYVSHRGSYHTFGHAEINAAMELATGDWLSFQDDDDIWTTGAVSAIRREITQQPDKLHLFRFKSYWNFHAWYKRGLIEQGFVGGHCIVCQNIPEKLGKWGLHYEGDFSFIQETVKLSGGPDAVAWHEDVIAIARPSV